MARSVRHHSHGLLQAGNELQPLDALGIRATPARVQDFGRSEPGVISHPDIVRERPRTVPAHDRAHAVGPVVVVVVGMGAVVDRVVPVSGPLPLQCGMSIIHPGVRLPDDDPLSGESRGPAGIRLDLGDVPFRGEDRGWRGSGPPLLYQADLAVMGDPGDVLPPGQSQDHAWRRLQMEAVHHPERLPDLGFFRDQPQVGQHRSLALLGDPLKGVNSFRERPRLHRLKGIGRPHVDQAGNPLSGSRPLHLRSQFRSKRCGLGQACDPYQSGA
jgi:hypothetical protein